MKKIKLLVVAFVAMFGFIACDKHECNDYDHSKDLVATWTCLQEGFAEALVIKADGSALSTGYDGEEFWENVAGSFVVENGMVTMTFEDGDNFHGHFDIIPGMAFSIYTDEGNRFTFNYCKEDLSEEVVGMWVGVDGPSDKEADMVIQVFDEEGTVNKTGWSVASNEFIVKEALTYKVVGDLLFHQRPSDMVTEGVVANFVSKLTYMPNANQLGDMLINTTYKVVKGETVELSMSMLRIKQHLELPGMKYDYMKTFVTNVKGEDKDIPFLNTSFNFAKMDGSIIDKFLKSILFTVEFPEADKIKYSYLLEGNNVVMEAPIQVDGNKMTIKMSANNPVYQDVDLYAFQDQDNTQMHWYMPTTSFEKFFANTSLALMLGYGQVDKNDTEAIAGVFKTIADAVESINLSIVMTKATKAL